MNQQIAQAATADPPNEHAVRLPRTSGGAYRQNLVPALIAAGATDLLARAEEVDLRPATAKPGDPTPEPRIPSGDLVLYDERQPTIIVKKLARYHQRHSDGLLSGETREAAIWDEHPMHAQGNRRGMRVIATVDKHPAFDKWLLHASVSYPEHLPNWRDVRRVKDALFGDVDAAMILPRAEDYVNINEYTLHLWQLPVVWGVR